MHPGAPSDQALQNALGQGLVVVIDHDTSILEKPLHALLKAIAGSFQRARRNDLAYLQALAAQNAKRHRHQIDHPGQGLLGQVSLQGLDQVGKPLVLWFDHHSLHGERDFLRGYDRSRPSPQRLSVWQCCLTSTIPQSARPLSPKWAALSALTLWRFLQHLNDVH